MVQPEEPLVLTTPPPLVVGSLTFDLFQEPGMKKTLENFKCLVTGEKGLSKASKKPLHYKGTPFHRLAPGFALQGGDTARGDGSGSDSICASQFDLFDMFSFPVSLKKRTPFSTDGGKFSQDAAGLKMPFKRGTLGMASSGAGKVSSQFFIALSNDSQQLAAKLNGKYVAFGQLRQESEGVLQALEAVGQKSEVPLKPIWVYECSVLQ